MAAQERHDNNNQLSEANGLNDIIPRLAQEIAILDSGSAAALRRGPLAGAGTAAFWSLSAKYMLAANREIEWAAVVQAISILTPIAQSKDKERRQSAHNPSHPMGSAICGAKVSDQRLARLLAAKGAMRRDLLMRVCRRLRNTEHRRFDLRTLGWFVVYGTEDTDRQIARSYYRSQSSVEAKEPQTNED